MKGKIGEYVKNVEKACGDVKEYIAILKQEKQKEATQKIAGKGKIKSMVAGVLLKMDYKGKEVSISGNKVLIRNIQSADEAEKILEELLE